MRPPVGADGCRYLVGYHYWASHRVLDVCDGLTAEQFAREVGGGFPSIQKTLNHLIECEGFFLYILGQEEPPDLTASDPQDPAAARRLWAARERLITAFAAGLDDAAAARPFKDPRGFETSPALVLVQMVNHGTHHRGQITTMMRQVGAVPLGMDLLMYAVG
jgi:uncharacterized damage-inducible protein DinB